MALIQERCLEVLTHFGVPFMTSQRANVQNFLFYLTLSEKWGKQKEKNMVNLLQVR